MILCLRKFTVVKQKLIGKMSGRNEMLLTTIKLKDEKFTTFLDRYLRIFMFSFAYLNVEFEK